MRIGKAFLYLLYAAAIIVLGTFITLSATKDNSPAPVKPPASSRTAGAAIGQAGSAAGKVKSTASSSGSATSAKSTAVATAKTGGDLADTGPGNLVYLFVSASVIGALAYRRFAPGRHGS